MSDIPDELKKIIAEKLALIERDLYDNTKKVQELRELLQ
jgi:hypothetical protein